MWVLMGLVSALLNSTSDVFLKVANRPKGDPPKIVDAALSGFLLYVCTAFVALPYALATEGSPAFDIRDAWPLAISGSLGVVSTICYVSAMRDAPLSLTAPLMAVTPMCLLVTGPLIAGDPWSFTGAWGILLCALGIYISNLEPGQPWYRPFTGLWRNRGQRNMLFATMIFSVSATVDRSGVERVGMGWYAVLLCVVIATGLAPLAVVALVKSSGRPAPLPLIASSLAAAGSLWGQFAGVLLAPVAYVICLKRLSTIFGPLMGMVFLGERQAAGRRLIGSTLLFAGVVTIALTSLSD